jgi:tRNA 2-thiouridine synthesizing protein A
VVAIPSTPTEVLDLRGLKCPLPALFARRALARAAPGGEIAIVSDDPLAAVDVPHMCHQEGHDVIAVERIDAGVRLVLRRRGSPSVCAQ